MIKVRVAARSPVVQAGLEAMLRGAGGSGADDSNGFEIVYSAAEADVLIAEGEAPPEGPPVILLTDQPGASLRSGIRGLLPTQVTDGELAAAVEAVAAGLVIVHPQFLDALVTATRADALSLDEPLTPREIDVLRLLAEGLGNKEAAYRLGISEHTVKFHVASLLDKLHANSRTEAVSIGLRSGLIAL